MLADIYTATSISGHTPRSSQAVCTQLTRSQLTDYQLSQLTRRPAGSCSNTLEHEFDEEEKNGWMLRSTFRKRLDQ